MITGIHAILYSKDAVKTRAFLKDILGLRSVDAGHGWLIFALPPAEIAAHPDDTGRKQELYLMCEDVKATVRQLKNKGVIFTRPITDRGWGLLTTFDLPGVGDFYLYQPKHPVAIKPAKAAAAKRSKPRTKAASKKAAKKPAARTRR